MAVEQDLFMSSQVIGRRNLCMITFFFEVFFQAGKNTSVPMAAFQKEQIHGRQKANRNSKVLPRTFEQKKIH